MKRILLATALALAVFAARASAQHAQSEAPAHGAHAAGEAAGSHGAAGEHDAAPLLPSNMEEAKEYFLAPAVWTLVIFVILLAILYPTAWKKVLAGLKAREERIRQDIADAEAARKKAETTLREYTQQLAAAEARVRDMISSATVEGEKVATNIRMQAQQEAEEAKERAQRDIEAAKNLAIREVHEQTALLATSIAEKILRRTLNADDQRDLVRQSLEQLQTVSSR